MDTQRAPFGAAHTAWHLIFLRGDRPIDEVSRFVRASHYAVTAADAEVAINQHYPILTLESRTGRADIAARWMGAMQAHHRQRYLMVAALFPKRHLTDPAHRLRIGSRRKSILLMTSCNTELAVGVTAGGIDQHPPPFGAISSPLSRGNRQKMDPRGEQCRPTHETELRKPAATPLVDARIMLGGRFHRPPPCRCAVETVG